MFSTLNIKIQLQQIPTTSTMPVSTMESSQVNLIVAKLALHLAMHGKMSTSTCLLKCIRSCISHENVQYASLVQQLVKNVLAHNVHKTFNGGYW